VNKSLDQLRSLQIVISSSGRYRSRGIGYRQLIGDLGIPAGVIDLADFHARIHRAEGVLMEQHSCLAVDALGMMADCAHRNRVDIGDVAAIVIATAQLPQDL
jgi:hypothetical protein